MFIKRLKSTKLCWVDSRCTEISLATRLYDLLCLNGITGEFRHPQNGCSTFPTDSRENVGGT